MGVHYICGVKLTASRTASMIPDTQFDWYCVDDNYDGAPDAGPQIVGWGATEEEAITDYLVGCRERMESDRSELP